MRISSESFVEGQAIPSEFAFCRADPEKHVNISDNRNPHLAWFDVPQGARSFVVICHDPDVPGSLDDFNKEDREIAASLPRITLYHWVLVDIPADIQSIGAGEFSNGVVVGGKPGPEASHGTRQGVNGYTAWFASDPDMKGDYFGYDGPCPPWNDSIRHRYIFTVYALDIEKLALPHRFEASDVLKAMNEHRLAEATITGTYSLNPRMA